VNVGFHVPVCADPGRGGAVESELIDEDERPCRGSFILFATFSHLIEIFYLALEVHLLRQLSQDDHFIH
jgi:hypothetical protein